MWNDPEIGIEWPLEQVREVLLSEKDQQWKSLKETMEVEATLQQDFEKR